jgi:L-asparagine transporter-like permease
MGIHVMKKKGLGAWQLTMMALGSVIGGSFFLGSAVAINAAGPSILLGFIFGGVLVYFILFAISEMTVANPSYGSFRTFAAEAFGKGTGFVVGWVYWTGMTLAMSSEATAVSILVKAWLPSVPIAVSGSIIIVGVTLLNLLGANKLSKLESGLAALKLFAIISFIIIAIILIIGLFPGAPAIGIGELAAEPLMPNGITGLAGSMLIVMFTYAGFEVIGLAASEAVNPQKTIPKAIRNTVISLVALYIVYIVVLLPLIPTEDISANTSPIVAAMNRQGMTWAGTALNVVLISAILSTMLAAMFGLGRMMRSLVDEGLAPRWLKDERDVPYRGILTSGFAMLISLGVGLLFPSAYLFLISSGGFAILFSYAVIMATHIRFRRKNGCPPDGKCQMWGFPYTSLFVLIALIVSIFSMLFVSGQASGLIAGCIVIVFYIICYSVLRLYNRREITIRPNLHKKIDMTAEISKELYDFKKNDNNDKH